MLTVYKKQGESKIESIDTTSLSLEIALKSEEFANSTYKIPLILGYDDHENLVMDDLTRNSHILVGGVTGSGKSVFLQNIIACLTSKFSSAEVQLALFDLKMVEFERYAKDLPHLFGNVVTRIDAAMEMFQRLVDIMNDRRAAIKSMGILSSVSRAGSKGGIDEYNAKTGLNLPRIVVIIDECADLIVRNDRAKEYIFNLVAHGPVAGIHLIISSQRTCEEIFPSTLRAIVTTRAVFKVADKCDSLLMLGDLGAEKLPYRFGEMMYFSIWKGNAPQKVRVPCISAERMLVLARREKKEKLEETMQ